MQRYYVAFVISYVMIVCIASNSSQVLRLNAKSAGASGAMKQVAQVLNVSVPANWADYMSSTTTDGSVGQAEVGISTLATVMASWLIPEEFRDQAVRNVKTLIIAAT
ncbi:unnamed protein product, partial [Rotaria sordida]